MGWAEFEYDLFISHASEDQDAFVRPLAEALSAAGHRVWYSEWVLTIGDPLRQSIDYGLARSRFGVVVLSESFFAKQWPRQELDGLAALEMDGAKRILPVWHRVNHEAVAEYSPTLADRLAIDSRRGISAVVEELIRAIKRGPFTGTPNRPTSTAIAGSDVAGTLKKLMARPESRIELSDTISAAVSSVATALQGAEFDAAEQPTMASVASRIFSYDTIVSTLLAGAAVGGRWADDEQLTDWVRAIQRVANVQAADGRFTVWNKLRLYPAMQLMYACGLGALSSRRYRSLWRLLTEPRIKEREVRVPACGALAPFLVAGGQTGKALPGKQRHQTPVSDHLLERLGELPSELYDDEDDFEFAFDEFEVWLTLAHANLGDREWLPVGRFAWNWRRREGGPRALFDDLNYRKALFDGGAFDADESRLDMALKAFDAFAARTESQFI